MDRLTTTSVGTFAVQSPYKAALVVFSHVGLENASLVYSPERQAFGLKGVSDELRARINALSGVAVLGPESAQVWRDAARTFPEHFRVTDEPEGRVKVVHLSDPGRRALMRIVTAKSDAARQALASTGAEMSRSFTLHCQRIPPEAATRAYGAQPARFVVTTAKAAYEEALKSGARGFAVKELEAMAVAVEVNRAHPRDLDQWLENKRRAPGWCLTPEASGALDVAGVTRETRSTWALGDVLDALGAELVDVDLPGGA